LQLIAEQGIEKLTYRNLAKKLGITEPAFYRHFSSKTEIMFGILVYFDGIRRELFTRIRTSSTGSLSAIESIFLKHFELFEKKPALAMILFPEAIRQNREELGGKVLEMMKTGQENIIAIIAEGMERGEIRDDIDKQQLALMISGTLRLLVTRWQLEKYSGDLQEQGRRFWQDLSRLIRNKDWTQSKAENSVERRNTQENRQSGRDE
jgi:AcrR family transcriptional regulator